MGASATAWHGTWHFFFYISIFFLMFPPTFWTLRCFENPPVVAYRTILACSGKHSKTPFSKQASVLIYVWPADSISDVNSHQVWATEKWRTEGGPAPSPKKPTEPKPTTTTFFTNRQDTGPLLPPPASADPPPQYSKGTGGISHETPAC